MLCNVIENSPTALAHNPVSLVKITSNLVQRHVVGSYGLYHHLGQIDYNLHNHVFDDVICIPPTDDNTVNVSERLPKHKLTFCENLSGAINLSVLSKNLDILCYFCSKIKFVL